MSESPKSQQVAQTSEPNQQERVQDAQDLFGKSLPSLPADGTSPSRRLMTFKLEPNTKIIKALTDIALMLSDFQRPIMAFLPTSFLHKSSDIYIMRCVDDIKNVEGISLGQTSGKILQNTTVFKKPIPQVLQVSTASSGKHKGKKDILPVKKNHFWPCLNKFIINTINCLLDA